MDKNVAMGLGLACVIFLGTISLITSFILFFLYQNHTFMILLVGALSSYIALDKLKNELIPIGILNILLVYMVYAMVQNFTSILEFNGFIAFLIHLPLIFVSIGVSFFTILSILEETRNKKY